MLRCAPENLKIYSVPVTCFSPIAIRRVLNAMLRSGLFDNGSRGVYQVSSRAKRRMSEASNQVSRGYVLVFLASEPITDNH